MKDEIETGTSWLNTLLGFAPNLRQWVKSIFLNDLCYGNIMVFGKDSTLKPMPRKGQPLEPYGKWYIFRKGFNYYMKVTGCADTLFNQTFLIKLTYRPGNFCTLQVLELCSDHLYIIGS